MDGATHLVPMHAKILQLLSDGRRHLRQEILDKCFDDELASPANLNCHLSNIRKHVLRPLGEDIICELNRRRICYRHVRLLCRTDE